MELSAFKSRKIGAQTRTTFFQFGRRMRSITSGKTNTFFLCLSSSCRNNISPIQRSAGDTLFTAVKQPQKDTVQVDSALTIRCLPRHASLANLASAPPEARVRRPQPQVAAARSNTQQSLSRNACRMRCSG